MDVGLMWCDFFLKFKGEEQKKKKNGTKKNDKNKRKERRETKTKHFISALTTKKIMN